jgi:predicted  nucleic acid-binding Zn-ribbon protein
MENTVAQKLDALVKLQTIDSKLDEINKVRGDLPEEVRDLEDELAGYETRVSKFESEIQKLEEEIQNHKQSMKDSEKLIKKYEEQQMNVRNNREYDAITKETELQQLEIQIGEKRIKESFAKIDLKKEEISKTDASLQERKKDLDVKKKELDSIIGESKEDEDKLLKDREKASKTIEERLLTSYNKIRQNVINGLAVVIVKRDACGGCFNTVPPQRQVDIREKKKLIVCEHCGRIFADVETPVVVEVAKK